MQYAATRAAFGADQTISTHDDHASAVTAMMKQVRNDDAALQALLGPGVSTFRLEHVPVDVDTHRLMVVNPDGEVVFSIMYRVLALQPF